MAPKRTVFLLLLIGLLVSQTFAKNEGWIEVRTPHFIVVSNSGEKESRRIADQFERMRAVFHKAFPNARVDSGSPITVLAVKDKKDFQALEPAEYLKKGQLELAGLFLQAPEKNYILLRLDAEGDHPYSTVYHEYTHFLLSPMGEWLPLWLNEGLAQFYEMTDIHDKDVALGQPNPGAIYTLRQNKLMPLPLLFKVDHTSPYYHEENKGSVFYGESWALTHFLMVDDIKNNSHRLLDYTKLVGSKVDPVEAAARTFGDLNALQKRLESYIGQMSFNYVRMPGAVEVDDNAFKVRAITVNDADATRADFLAYNNRLQDAHAILDRVLHDDPNNVLAYETMGFLAFRANNLEEAGKWYGKAVKLDSQSYLAHYYYAMIAMREPSSAEHDEQIETSLKAVNTLNPQFAPAYDALAMYYGMHHKNLEEAHSLCIHAIELDPDNLNYRLNAANVQLEMKNPQNAILILTAALKVAKNDSQTAMLNDRITSLKRYADGLQQEAEFDATRNEKGQIVEEVVEKVEIPTVDESKHGAKRSVRGVLRDIKCAYPALMTLRVETAKPVDLRSGNYLKIEYSALNFQPSGELNPCKDLEGMKATVDYFEAPEPDKPGFITAIQVTK